MLCRAAAKPSHALCKRENRMSVHEPTPLRAAIPSVDVDRAVNFGVGVVAVPLWATFFTAASAGMAYWWMTAAWTRREPKSFASAKSAAQAEIRSPAPVRIAESAPRQPEPVAAPASARERAHCRGASGAPPARARGRACARAGGGRRGASGAWRARTRDARGRFSRRRRPRARPTHRRAHGDRGRRRRGQARPGRASPRWRQGGRPGCGPA